MLHVGDDYIQSKMINHRPQFLDTFLIGCHLRTNISQILLDIPYRVGCAFKQTTNFSFEKFAFTDELNVIDQNAFLFNYMAVRRHGSWRDSTDISMMPSGGDIKQNGAYRLFEYRSDDSNIR